MLALMRITALRKQEDDIMERKKWLTTDYPEIIFEDNTVGRLKKEVWDASEQEGVTPLPRTQTGSIHLFPRI